MEIKNKVWLVTGASKGLGLALVKKLLLEGFYVAATSRKANSLVQAFGSPSPNFLPLETDLADAVSVLASVEKAIQHFGSLDVIVNNAGYGQIGALEEITDEECRRNFDINVFGTLNVIRSTMPYLRRQRSGHIFNISSIAGFVGAFPGWGSYCASKFAVNGLSESLAAEVASLGIKVTIVQPGYFRTDFISSEALALPNKVIEQYEAVRVSQRIHQQEIHNNQPGDPEKAASALIRLSMMENPPLRILLGSDAYEKATEKVQILQSEFQQNKDLSFSTDF
jgi:NAD(P)-dependent dehydrogenase (short-subunit alcohol dehydrogenase family)